MTQRVVVVGYCASGKSTVVAALQARGVDAQAVAQEHSAVRDLWNHPHPDIVIFLDVEIDDIRRRRDNPAWPEWIYELQRSRLEPARERADLIVNSSELDVDQIVSRIADVVNERAQS
jgi:hypothetical protein